MADYIEGKRPVIEALRTHVPVKRILMADNIKRDGLVADILRKAKNLDVPVVNVSRKKLDEISSLESNQGVIAEARPFEYVNVGAILKAAERCAERNEGRALVVVLDHITDAGNLGAIARSAESVGASGLIIPNKRSARVTAATYKSSAGAIAHISVAQVANISSSLERLKKAGFWVAAATEHAQGYIWDANLKGKIALVLGNEGEGVSDLVLSNCDFGVKLPQVGEISSLNVAQASTACMYEWLRQNRTAAEGLSSAAEGRRA